jgi:hypothetical protein
MKHPRVSVMICLVRGGIRTTDLGTMSRVAYHCSAGTTKLSITTRSIMTFRITTLRIMTKVMNLKESVKLVLYGHKKFHNIGPWC